ncbi:hypothetical protein H310_03620 [Aphanomyces invadans]|uniref:COP9 signalosome complex subunit 3 n=1 Tax=Aphanomyces invadans TaxID=157072 RepID=A0A024UHV1_9STRA|nr:hypothetical protein H310_03620 [Aphanomyces invadans]ETW06001.1 hypothetical protein H310_03620 [Aphanomyces invadans]|eukprot:XP_008865778.1 hypothetical protein H310_03620 [Aphanomyces invadans]
MASLTDFILTNCKKSGTALECSDLWKEVSTASVDDLDHALECLNAIDYAAAMAYLLLVKGKKLSKLQRQDRTGDSNADDGDVDMAVQADGNDDRNAKLSFLHQVISYLGDIVGVPEEAPDASRLSDLVQLAVQVAIAIHETIRLVYPLRQLLQKWRSSELSRQNALTPYHSTFVLACVYAKCYHAALSVVDEPIFDIASPQAAVQSIHVLEYFYYGGMVYTGLKQFRAAATFFLMTLTVPAYALSAIAIEAYKKFILVSLLSDGQVSPLPKSASPAVSRALESYVAPYVAFMKAFTSSSSTPQVVAVAAADIPDNGGLVKQCLVAFKQIRVQKLPQVYTTVSLTKVAAEIHATISDAEACMLDVIEAGAITAAIDKQQDMVQLNPPSFDETNLHASIEHAIAFTTRLHEIDALLTMHPKYIGRTKDKRGAKFATDDAAGGSWMAQQVSG